MSELTPDISSRGRGFSPIWIIPVVALVIGVWMVIHNWMTQGPEITVTFKTAEGLEAGKTKVKYRDVVMGTVDEVTLSDDRQNVVTSIKLDREATPMLREDTRFWVVRARVGVGAISGLGTLLSGAYIHLEPGEGKPGIRDFTGLEEPPLTPADAPGLRLTLFSDHAGSVGVGDPITYNGYKVGRIESMSFDSKRREVRYDAFIDAPYNDLVDGSTRFWNASGVSIDLSADGVKVNTASLYSLLVGGVAFGKPPNLPAGDPVEPGTSFQLYDSYDEIRNDPFRHSINYVVLFKQSLRGLVPGAPVEYRGIQLGTVQRILIREMAKSGLGRGYGEGIPVLIRLEPGRLQAGDNQKMTDMMKETIAAAVEHGGRATLQTGNLITGKLYIDFDFYPDEEPAEMAEFDGYPVIPSIPTGLGRMEKQVSSLLDKLNALPLETTVDEANKALASITGVLEDLQSLLQTDSTRQLPEELNQTLAELRKTLAGFSPNSPAGQSLADTVIELNRTLRNLEALTHTLRSQPNAILFPTDLPEDPEPKAP